MTSLLPSTEDVLFASSLFLPLYRIIHRQSFQASKEPDILCKIQCLNEQCRRGSIQVNDATIAQNHYSSQFYRPCSEIYQVTGPVERLVIYRDFPKFPSDIMKDSPGQSQARDMS
jgi:hypothetical protein